MTDLALAGAALLIRTYSESDHGFWRGIRLLAGLVSIYCTDRMVLNLLGL